MKNNLTVTLKPYKYLVHSQKTNSIIVMCFLIPQILLLLISKSWMSLAVSMSAVAATLLVEVIGSKGKEKKLFYFINAINAGILTGLFLPSTFPPAAAFLITFLTFLVCRYFIGGFADSWVNVSALSVVICWILGPKLFPAYQITPEILMTRNPSLELINNGTIPVMAIDTRITASLNKTIFSLFGVSIPEGYVSLFWDTHALVPAFRFNFVTLVSSIVLFSIDTIKPLIPGIFIAVYGLLIYFVSPVFFSAGAVQGDLLLAMCSSGILLTALFMLQHAGTTPITTTGKIIYAILAGVIAFFIIGAGTSPVGAAFTVLAVNVFSTIIQNVEHHIEMKATKNKLLDKITELKEGKNA